MFWGEFVGNDTGEVNNNSRISLDHFNQVQSISSKKKLQAMTTKAPLLINLLTNVVKGDCRLVFVDGDN
jgi:hypothetical protein